MIRRALTAALILLSVVILAIGWALNDDRWREGPVEITLWRNHGLHRMDVIMLGLAALPWLGVAAMVRWPKRRP